MAKAATPQNKTVFLSHSSDDDDLAAGAVQILENHGGHVYLDHGDPNLSDSDCAAIAEELRNAIRRCKRFVMLATPRSKDSKWIPWELGLGDGVHNPTNVAIFPAAENSFDQDWAEREYLRLYRKIVWGRLEGYEDFLWLVLDMSANTAVKLADWLR